MSLTTAIPSHLPSSEVISKETNPDVLLGHFKALVQNLMETQSAGTENNSRNVVGELANVCTSRAVSGLIDGLKERLKNYPEFWIAGTFTYDYYLDIISPFGSPSSESIKELQQEEFAHIHANLGELAYFIEEFIYALSCMKTDTDEVVRKVIEFHGNEQTSAVEQMCKSIEGTPQLRSRHPRYIDAIATYVGEYRAKIQEERYNCADDQKKAEMCDNMIDALSGEGPFLKAKLEKPKMNKNRPAARPYEPMRSHHAVDHADNPFTEFVTKWRPSTVSPDVSPGLRVGGEICRGSQ